MTTAEIIREIEKLPMSERILVIEKAIRTLRREQDARQMRLAGEELSEDYKTDKELTAFIDLDMEDFYEPR